MIDNSGLRVAYIIDKNRKIVVAVSDSEIKKAIHSGEIKDVDHPRYYNVEKAK